MKYAAEIAAALLLFVLISYSVSCHFGSKNDSARSIAARMQVEVLSKFLESSKSEYGQYPAQLDLDDPWSIPYVYSLVDGKPRVCSHGPDHRSSTSDDICAP